MGEDQGADPFEIVLGGLLEASGTVGRAVPLAFRRLVGRKKRERGQDGAIAWWKPRDRVWGGCRGWHGRGRVLRLQRPRPKLIHALFGLRAGLISMLSNLQSRAEWGRPDERGGMGALA